MMNKQYGGVWQEFRAYIATILFDLALKIHFQSTMDMVHELDQLQDAVK